MMKHSSCQFDNYFSGFGHQSKKFLVTLAPILGAISHPDIIGRSYMLVTSGS